MISNKGVVLVCGPVHNFTGYIGLCSTCCICGPIGRIVCLAAFIFGGWKKYESSIFHLILFVEEHNMRHATRCDFIYKSLFRSLKNQEYQFYANIGLLMI